jgi:hypothetical protein
MCNCKVKLTITPDGDGASARITYCSAHTATAELSKAANSILAAMRQMKKAAEDTNFGQIYRRQAAIFDATIEEVERLLSRSGLGGNP